MENMRHLAGDLPASLSVIKASEHDAELERVKVDRYRAMKQAIAANQQLEGAVEALELIAEHARRDVAEHGITEALRYVGIAEDALNRVGGR